MSEWLPIEDAPKDGTYILIAGGVAKKPFEVVRWVDDDEPVDDDGGDWVPADWAESDNALFNAALGLRWGPHPSHWYAVSIPPIDTALKEG